MSEIIIPESNEEEKELKINYDPTEYDEEEFILMYHMHIQPSEIKAWTQEKRQWVVGRFMIQKKMEREMMEQFRIRSQLGNIKV